MGRTKKQFELAANGSDQAALYLIRKGAVREAQVRLLYTALKDLLDMPEYDGTAATSQLRLRAKNAAKRALKTVERGDFKEQPDEPERPVQTRRHADEDRDHP